ncbi:amino acid ABC transporter permease [Rhodobacterales bacterium]|nr:amino acid ABC transporter permease [Rhodobacterales bacterium]
MTNSEVFHIRTEEAPSLAAPASTSGAIGWMRQNLFSSVGNTILTIIGILIAYSLFAPLIQFALIDAVWTGENRDACLPQEAGEHVGACWAYVKAYLPQFIYGRYPTEEIWRVNIVYFLFAALLIPLAIPKVPFKAINAILFLGVFPFVSLVLLTGGDFDIGFWGWGFVVVLALIGVVIAAVQMFAGGQDFAGVKPVLLAFVGTAVVIGAIFTLASIDFGLPVVETAVWGGLLMTLVIAVTGIVASLPLGIVLALGRRSQMPIVRLLSVIFIEFWRGVPLITVLFMSSVVLPLFLPEGVTFDKLLRVLIGVTLFSAAYMAEVVRGGLQAIPKGQYEGAMALGLRFWPMMYLIILPQALKLVIPGIVNTFIGLFKDTTLVLIVGMFDLLGQIQSSFSDPTWSTPTQGHTGYLFAAIVYWCFCFGMSRYSIFIENKLNTGHKR